MSSPTQFLWTGTLGPSDTDWNGASGTLTNWRDLTDNTTTIVPGALGDEARFTDGGADTVSGTARVDQITIENNTFVTINSGHIDAGDLIASNNASFPDDLVVDDDSKLSIMSGAAMSNDGSVSVIGLQGAGSLEVGSGGGFGAEALILGDSDSATGVATVTGAAGFFVVAPFGGGSGNGELTIGQMGAGSLDVASTPAFFSTTAVLGLNQGAVGDLTVDASTWSGSGLTIGAAGVGHVTIGSGTTVTLADVVVGSGQSGSGDLSVTGAEFDADFLTVGMAGTGTAMFGSGSTGTFAAVTVGDSVGAIANMTMDGATWNASTLTIGFTGTGHATAGAGEVVTVNDLELGSGADASGDLTIDAASLNGGTVSVGHDGTGDLAIESGSSGSVAAVIVGEDLDSSGTLTIDDANWSVGSLTVGQTGTGQATVGTGATATLDNVLIGPSGGLAVTEAAGSAATVIAQQVAIDFGVLDLSQGGQMLIGAGTGTNGAVAIGNKSSLTGLGSLEGNVVLSNGGLVQATGPVPGALKIDGNITGAGTIAPLMTLEANGGIAAGVTIGFSPSVGAQVGDLVLDVASGEQGTITGFGNGNTIDIKGLTFSSAVFTQGTSGSPGTLTLSGGSAPLSLAFLGDYAADAFTATPVTVSGAGIQQVSGAFTGTGFAGTQSADTIVTVVTCFAPGTRIATATGPVAIEDLAIGDWLVTVDGTLQPIVRIERRDIDCTRHREPGLVWPIRIAAGAFGDRGPVRNLYLSPDHAVFVDNALVPARLLINGTSITQVARERITYRHVELPRHAVIFAEGLTVESYLDVSDATSPRFSRDGWRLFPRFGPATIDTASAWETRGAAPLVVSGERLAMARRAANGSSNSRHARMAAG